MLNKRPLKIVAIGHETSLSGAPILLFNLFSLLKEEPGVLIDFAVLRDGTLTSMYRQSFPVLVLKNSDYGKEKSPVRKVYNFLKNKIQLVRLGWQVLRCDFIFSNTIVNGKVLRLMSVFKKPVITYVHELETVIDTYLKLGDAKYSIYNSDIFAYPSKKVRDTLTMKYSVPAGKLLPLNYYFPFGKKESRPSALTIGNKWEKFGIRENDFVIGGMGFASKRKGTDIFTDVFNLVYNRNTNIKFCWIGDFETEEFRQDVFNKIPTEALGKNIIFTGSLKNSFSNFIPFDLFFLSSREDPYPLVVLEAAWMGKPSICFKDSGGIPEFVESDAGWVIDKFDAQAVSDKILDLWNDREEIQRKGVAASEKVVKVHGNASVILQQFELLLKDAKN